MVRKNKKSKKELPFKWREDVQEILASKGIKLDLQKISNIKTGRTLDEVLTPEVADAVLEVRAKYKKLRALVDEL